MPHAPGRSRFFFSAQQLVARGAGIAPEEAVTRIRERLRRAYGESLTRAAMPALNDRNRPASRRALTDPLLLDDRPELTPEAFAKIDSEFEQLAQRYEPRAASVPAQRRKALAFGVLVTGAPLALLYLLGELLARTRATARADTEAVAAPAGRAPDARRISSAPPRPQERDREAPTPGALPA